MDSKNSKTNIELFQAMIEIVDYPALDPMRDFKRLDSMDGRNPYVVIARIFDILPDHVKLTKKGNVYAFMSYFTHRAPEIFYKGWKKAGLELVELTGVVPEKDFPNDFANHPKWVLNAWRIMSGKE